MVEFLYLLRPDIQVEVSGMLNVANKFETTSLCATVSKHGALKMDRRIIAGPSTTPISMVRDTVAYNQPIEVNYIIVSIRMIFKTLLRNYAKNRTRIIQLISEGVRMEYINTHLWQIFVFLEQIDRGCSTAQVSPGWARLPDLWKCSLIKNVRHILILYAPFPNSSGMAFL